MRASGLFAVVFSLVLLSLRSEAYEARGYTDTSDGYCVGEYGVVPVGGTGYDDIRCERILCTEGMYTRQGCGVVAVKDLPSNCELVSRPGHYPNCCKQFVECEDDDSSEEE
ncbi:toxin-like protein 14 [Argiope bruennichi]|uniref:Single domain-containing protein n=1 Tax=Argiope bruennichi TaxID=94029 RepID=A0A8T0FXI8_ARGBR|nr:toxin-like protein 14 [Argiope bruennichi]KAF8793553.1 hypothetical protein HNY73_001611 [Argiope bruennichi]